MDVGDLCQRPSHHPGYRNRPLDVADQEVLGGERSFFVIEGDELLALVRPPNDDARALQERQIERMQGLADLEHRVVRGVDRG